MADNTVRVRFTADASGVNSAMSNIGGNADALSNKLKSIGAALGAAFAADKIIGFGKNVMSTYMTFDDSMKQVAATMGITANSTSADYVKLENAAKQMGETTRFSASEAANALNYLALAGYDTDKSIESLPKALNLAQAGGMDLARACDMLTDSMSALGLSTSDMDKFADQMAKTSQKSNTSVSQLGEAVLTVGEFARNLSGGTAELNTLLGMLADVGIKGAEGGTSLRNMIRALAAPDAAGKKMIDALGLSVGDAAGNLRPMNEILEDLRKKLSGLGGTQRSAILSKIFNAYDLKAAEGLLGATNERFEELMGLILDSEGASEQMAATMESGIGGAVRSLKSAFEGLQNAVKMLTSLLQDMIKNVSTGEFQAFLRESAEGFVKLLKFVIDSAKKLWEMRDAIKTFITVLAGVKLQGIISQFSGLASAIGQTGTAAQNSFASIQNLQKLAALGVSAGAAAASQALSNSGNATGASQMSAVSQVAAATAVGGAPGGIISGVTQIIKGIADIDKYKSQAQTLTALDPFYKQRGSLIADYSRIRKEVEEDNRTYDRTRLQNVIDSIKQVNEYIRNNGGTAVNMNNFDIPGTARGAAVPAETPASAPTFVMPDMSASESTGKTDGRTAFEKALDALDTRFETREDLAESRIDLASAQNDKPGEKSAKNALNDLLREKLAELTGIKSLAANSDETNIWETARNKLLAAIAQNVETAAENLGKLAGSFNAPSGVSPLTEYAFKAGGTFSRNISTPTANFYLQVDTLDKSAADKVRGQLNIFASRVFDKNSAVYDGMADAVRN